MEKLIEFRKSLIFKDKTVIFRDLDFSVEKNRHVAIIGPSGSGKSVLLKSLVGILSSNGLFLKGTRVEKNIDILYKNVAVVLNDMSFICDSVYKELAFSLYNMNLPENEVNESVLSLADYFNFTEFLNYDPSLLTHSQKVLLKILSFVIIYPQLLAIDDLFIYLNSDMKELIMKFLKEKDITLLLATSDIEDTLFVDYIYVVNEGVVLAEGLRDSIYTEEKLLNRIGYGLPMLIDLSTQLKYYGMVDDYYTTYETLVDAIWK